VQADLSQIFTIHYTCCVSTSLRGLPFRSHSNFPTPSVRITSPLEVAHLHTVFHDTVVERAHEHENHSSCGHVPRHRRNSPSCCTSGRVNSQRYSLVEEVQLLVQGLCTGVRAWSVSSCVWLFPPIFHASPEPVPAPLYSRATKYSQELHRTGLRTLRQTQVLSFLNTPAHCTTTPIIKDAQRGLILDPSKNLYI
jgi:hypothetical protein